MMLNPSNNEILVPLVFLLAFLIGSVPFGYLIARFFKVKDLAQQGSGNIGATNVSRVVGFWPAGVMTFVLDCSKGAFGVALALPLGRRLLSWMLTGDPSGSGVELSEAALWLAGFFTVLGHCYTPWLQFKGGKGVATGLGVILVLSPLAALFGMFGFSLTFLDTRIVSLSSIVGVFCVSVGLLMTDRVGSHLWVAALLVFLILMRHEANIDALLENREKHFRS